MKHFLISIVLAGALTSSANGHALSAHPSETAGLIAADSRALRSTRLTTSHVPARARKAWERFLADVGGQWLATWDETTLVPLRVFGTGVIANGSNRSARIAEAFSRGWLTRHLELLAPGANEADFVLTANEVLDTPGGELRVVAFRQEHEGLPVEGGQLSFRFKRDRLIVIASEALPFVQRVRPAIVLDDAAALARAAAFIETHGARGLSSTGVTALSVDGVRILPLVGAARVLAYRTALAVTVRATRPVGLYTVYLDPQSGEPIAHRQELRFGEATVRFDVPVRRPTAERQFMAAPFVDVLVNGQATATSELGVLTVPDLMTSTLSFGAKGSRVTVNNEPGKDETVSFDVAPGGEAVWGAPNKPFVDSQLTSYVHAHVAKTHGRTIAPNMKWLDALLPVNVNIDDACNAFYDGTSINFFRAAGPCENTGRLADVVYHEFGHGFHHHAIIPGLGSFDSALSEGLSDFYAASITGDPGMGRGFFFDDEPLRHIDPAGEAVWPEHIAADPHTTGLIIGGTLWDLRKLLIEKHGEVAGKQLTNELFYAMARTSVDIPSTYSEVLAADDDDGDLENGTPNVCEIIDAFGRHGLRTLAASVAAPDIAPPTQDGYQIAIHIGGLYEFCAADKIDAASIRWRREGQQGSVAVVPMAGGPTDFAASIPQQPDGTTVRFRVALELGAASTISFPDNLADPNYQLFVGDVTPIYCTDFETDPFQEGWTHALTAGSNEDGADDWQWGMPTSAPPSGDPDAAYSGTRLLGNDLGHGIHTGEYEPEKVNFVLSPPVDVRGFVDVRLQYRRWLTVEDGFYDAATVYVNDQLAWQNYQSGSEDDAEIHHVDREWRFHDLPLTPYVNENGQLQVKFELATDAGFELGGWSIDDFCIVGRVAGAVPAVCGDGALAAAELCDDGNLAPGDGCDASCQLEPASVPRRPQRTIVITSGCGCRIIGESAHDQRGIFAIAAILGGFGLARRRRSRAT